MDKLVALCGPLVFPRSRHIDFFFLPLGRGMVWFGGCVYGFLWWFGCGLVIVSWGSWCSGFGVCVWFSSDRISPALRGMVRCSSARALGSLQARETNTNEVKMRENEVYIGG